MLITTVHTCDASIGNCFVGLLNGIGKQLFRWHNELSCQLEADVCVYVRLTFSPNSMRIKCTFQKIVQAQRRAFALVSEELNST